MWRVMVLFGLVLVAGCDRDSPGAPAGVVDLRVVLAPGQTAAIDRATRIRFERVTGDSRCPADALCVWAGDATVQVTVLASADAALYELHTLEQRPVSHDDLSIALEQLQPYPFSGKAIDPSDYRATLHVTR